MISRRDFTKLALVGTLGASHDAFAAVAPRLSKRGCCFTAKSTDAAWVRRIESLNPAWLYSWGSQRPEKLPKGVEFTPMIWGNSENERFSQTIADLRKRAELGELQYLLGFNEPDQQKQSNMTVERVLELWPGLMEVGVPLVSPGCVHPDREWMNDFMEQVDQGGLRVDAISVHSYMGPSVEHLVRRLEAVHQRFGRPLWITEFAVGDWQATTRAQNRHSPQRIASFMRELLPTLDTLDYIHRYAWFSAAPDNGPLGTSALIGETGALTELGRIYANHPRRPSR
ncbi:glycosyl hydrolase [Botrimarina hoheduenensis]|uniref:Glycosyl hydrolase catalytic core n=1 Tax=Botrimarina hoheduenensis TaxID=2528000 RepID=A0A5C5WCQ8_9BACT|nr:glycosyl hydrolase [Botrimarina hoheduenensis]TWT47841.1 Glycosyl hydrolase catalytic core [Botrimarina hoheduenensis]